MSHLNHAEQMLTLSELLEMPTVRRARPLVVTGEGGLSRPVRWVHTSEIFEISPLLQGGEVLLTTGLGLVGKRPGEIATYVSNLVDRNVTALMVEIGRTFSHLPITLLTSATKAGLTLIELHQIVPFVEITEATHREIIMREQEFPAKNVLPNNLFLEHLASGATIRSVIELAQRTSGEVVSYVDISGEVVMSSTDHLAEGEPTSITEVFVNGTTRGAIHIFGKKKNSHSQVGVATAQSIAILLSRGDMPLPLIRREWLLALLASPDDPEISSEIRAKAAGLELSENILQPIIFSGFSPNDRSELLAELSKSRIGIIIDLDDCLAVIALTSVLSNKERIRTENFQSTLESIIASLNNSLRQRLRITAGDPVSDISSLGRNMRTARSASRINELLGTSATLRYASELGAHQLLANSVPDRALELFIDEQIGALIDADAQGSRDLVGTLEALARAGFSKTVAAGALGIRRQTLHNRLAKIEAVLGSNALQDSERRFSLHVALVAWRLRISAAAHH